MVIIAKDIKFVRFGGDAIKLLFDDWAKPTLRERNDCNGFSIVNKISIRYLIFQQQQVVNTDIRLRL